MKHTLIFADVHLKVGPAHAADRAAFVDFLRSFDPAEFDRVVCLGDLFDFWFEYRHVIFSDYFDVLRVFAEWRDAGIEQHLICGNHDFWAGRFLRETLGMHIHPDGVTLPFGTQRAHFVHGDGINPADVNYRRYKRLARNPFVVGAFRLLHPDWAMALAQRVSHGSRTYFGTHDPYEGPEAKALRAFAEAKLAAGEADVVLCGHSHAPERVAFTKGLYINPGDWQRRRMHVLWNGEGFLHYREGTPWDGTPA